MTVLVLGATGATGRLLVAELLSQGHSVRAVVRSLGRLPASLREHDGLEAVEASVLNLGDAGLAGLIDGCAAVASCLGHNLTLRGVFGSPRRLVTDSVRRVCETIRSLEPAEPVRFVLMSSAGVRNRGVAEPVSFAHRLVVGLIRCLVPPHADNEGAAEYFRTTIGSTNPRVEWVVVRPDSLIDEPEATGYERHASPIRSAIFDPGKTSRANVAQFMADLITDADLMKAWSGQMPVIYNRDGSA